MAIWKEQTSPNKDVAPPSPGIALKAEPEYVADMAPSLVRHSPSRESKESVIAADITITGKIDGTGNVRLAGRFEGDVHIEGNLIIDVGAKLTGGVHAKSVAIGGEVDGNIESAASVELLTTGVLNGDLKAGTLTVAAGSRMRGRAEFGWGEELPAKSGLTLGTRQAS